MTDKEAMKLFNALSPKEQEIVIAISSLIDKINEKYKSCQTFDEKMDAYCEISGLIDGTFPDDEYPEGIAEFLNEQNKKSLLKNL